MTLNNSNKSIACLHKGQISYFPSVTA